MKTLMRKGRIHEGEAWCSVCGTIKGGELKAGSLDCTRAARKHVAETGHSVTVYREQAVHIEPAP